MYSDKLLSWNIILRIYQVNAQLFKKKKKTQVKVMIQYPRLEFTKEHSFISHSCLIFT